MGTGVTMNMPNLADPDNPPGVGSYYLSPSTVGGDESKLPAPKFYGYVRVDGTGRETFYWAGVNYGQILTRYRTPDEWGPIEWVNPPMKLGEEYRTTERHNGKPVYALAFDFGALPNSDIKNVTIPKWTSHNIVFDLKITAHSSNETIPVPTGLSYDYASSYWFISTTSALFSIRSKSDLSKYSSCVVTLKYTKTTD